MDLGSRMKLYEKANEIYLMRRTPVIIRIDGKAFHSFTRGMEKPFDQHLMTTMMETTLKLVSEVPNCYFGYTQSDEISLLIIDYKDIETEPWFKNRISKIESVVASMATTYFNSIFYKDSKVSDIEKWAMFDARARNYPRDEVVNYFIWRQKDATNNSIQMVGQANFSHKELQKKNTSDIQDMLFLQKGINWNNLSPSQKRGTAVYKQKVLENDILKSDYIIDASTPIFTEDRNYIQRYVDIDINGEESLIQK